MVKAVLYLESSTICALDRCFGVYAKTEMQSWNEPQNQGFLKITE